MSEDIHIRGLSDLNQSLQTLPDKLQRNVLRGAMRAGARVILDGAKANVPVKLGILRDGIGIGTRVRGATVTAYVKTKGKHGYLAGWLEFGTKAHEIRPKGAKSLFFAGIFDKIVKHPGIRPRPFFRPALDAGARDAVIEAARYIRERLETKLGIDTSYIFIDGDE